MPGKILKPFWKEYTLLEFLIKRLQTHEETSRITLATVEGPENDPVADTGKKCGVEVVRGPEENVVERMGMCLGSTDSGYIARVTADNPFTDPELFILQLKAMKNIRADYSYCKLCPVGTSADIWTMNCFRATVKNSTTCYEKEHVNAWVWDRPETNRILWFVPPVEYMNNKLNLSVDREEDLVEIRELAIKLEDPLNANIIQIKSACFKI